MPSTSTTTLESKSSSLVVETDSNEANTVTPQDILKPTVNVPDDPHYSMNRWLRQTPDKEPWKLLARPDPRQGYGTSYG
ncbi:hypothetical protein LTR86_008849 [Recurvomyces mirabilis]|nr:hypothetical protein LTR86_008849 [Recurvomyces mirabilis]